MVIVIPVLALACVAMWFSTSLPLLVFVVFVMRLFGQGMMNQNAFTAAGRWFVAQRGKAMAVTAIGLPAGEHPFAANQRRLKEEREISSRTNDLRLVTYNGVTRDQLAQLRAIAGDQGAGDTLAGRLS